MQFGSFYWLYEDKLLCKHTSNKKYKGPTIRFLYVVGGNFVPIPPIRSSESALIDKRLRVHNSQDTFQIKINTIKSCLYYKFQLYMWPTELTTRFGWESVRLIPRDLGHCPRRRTRWEQWARSRGINPDSHTKRVDNSGSATTVLATNTFIMKQNVCFCLKGKYFFLKSLPSLLFWSCDTNRPISIKKMGLLPCQPIVVPRSFGTTFFWDYCPASRV